MVKFIGVLIFSLITLVSYAQELDQAFFDVFELDKKLVVKAKLPSTIKNALLSSYPTLKNAAAQADLETGLLVYLRQHLEIISKNDSLIYLERIEELPQTGEEQENLYLLVYGNYQDFKRIKNTCLFETNKEQQNFHIVELPDKTKLEMTTNKKNPSFKVKSPSLLQNRYIIPGIGLLIFGLILWFAKKRWIKKWW